MERDTPSVFLFGYSIFKFDFLTDLSGGIENHLPFKLCYLGSTKARAGGQENDDSAS